MNDLMFPCAFGSHELNTSMGAYVKTRGYNFNTLQAENKLEYFPSGAWLVRYSQNQDAIYVTQMTECGRAINFPVKSELKVKRLFKYFPLNMHVNKHGRSNWAISSLNEKPGRDLRIKVNVEKTWHTKNIPLPLDIQNFILDLFIKLIVKKN